MLDAEIYEMLARLSLAMKHKSSQNRSGNRRSVQKGTSAEFSDFREYIPGDDLRRLDWNVYARSERMYIREYLEEKESVVSVLIDTSASMNYGSQSKAELARDLGAVVSFLTLNHMDRLLLYDWKEMQRPLILSGGKNALPKALKWLEQRAFSGETDLFESAKKMKMRGAGVTVIISDFFAKPLLDDANLSLKKMMKYFAFMKQRPVLLQTLCPEELCVNLEGTRNLIDMETGERLRVTMRADTIARYEKELLRLKERLEKSAVSADGVYVLCDSGRDRRTLIMEDLRDIYAI